MQSLFEAHGLDCSFLNEQVEGLYPDSDEMEATPELCPNPWTTLFVTEDGNVHLCFLAEPVGNLYQQPLAEIWNSPRAVAKRSDMMAGRYLKSGCSPQWCSWRDGKPSPQPARPLVLLEEMKELAARLPGDRIEEPPPAIGAVRRMLSSRDRRIAELESLFGQLCEKNGAFHAEGRRYIDELEALVAGGQRHIDHLEAKARAAVEECERLRAELNHPLVRAARRLVR